MFQASNSAHSAPRSRTSLLASALFAIYPAFLSAQNPPPAHRAKSHPLTFEVHMEAGCGTEQATAPVLPRPKGSGYPVCLDKKAIVDQHDLKFADVQQSGSLTPAYVIIHLNDEAAKRLEAAEHIGSYLGVFINGRLSRVLTIKAITGTVWLGDNLTDAQASALAQKLNEQVKH